MFNTDEKTKGCRVSERDMEQVKSTARGQRSEVNIVKNTRKERWRKKWSREQQPAVEQLLWNSIRDSATDQNTQIKINVW